MSGIKVFAPATVAHIAVGFDVLALAIERPGDEVIATKSDKKGVRITEITGHKGRLPYEVDKNTAGVAVQKFLEHISEPDRGIDLKIHKKMPLLSGLGGSAATAAAAVWATSQLLKKGLYKRDLLPFACAGEAVITGRYSAATVASALFGGIVLVRDNAALDVHRLHIPKGIYVVVIRPHYTILEQKRQALLDIPISKVTEQSGNIAAFVLGLFKGDVGLVGRSLKDVVVEPQRAALIPGFYDVQQAALGAQALGCSICGNGPSVFALCANSLIAENVATAMQAAFKSAAKLKSDRYISLVNQEGAIVC